MSTHIQWQEGTRTDESSYYFDTNVHIESRNINHHISGASVCDVLRADARRVCAENGFDVSSQDFNLLESGILQLGTKDFTEPARVRDGSTGLMMSVNRKKGLYNLRHLPGNDFKLLSAKPGNL